MSKKIKLMCPLGASCQTETDDEIVRCQWYTMMRGTHPQTGEALEEWGCAMGWLPVLLVENSNQVRSSGAAIESFRNEMVKGNAKTFMRLVDEGKNGH